MHMLIQDSYQMQIQKFPDLSSIKGCKKKQKRNIEIEIKQY